MKTLTPTLDYYGLLTSAVRKHVHELIALGYVEAVRRAKVNNTRDETEITGFICEAIEEELDCSRVSWYRYYSVYDDPHLKDKIRAGKRRLRADIIIKWHSKSRGRPAYIFEAKRLSHNGHGVDIYIGPSGLGCFTNGVYASSYDEAGMLGYVQDSQVSDWKTKINKMLDAKASESGIWLEPPQRDVNVINALSDEWISQHKRPSIGRTITVYHILLDFVV